MIPYFTKCVYICMTVTCVTEMCYSILQHQPWKAVEPPIPDLTIIVIIWQIFIKVVTDLAAVHRSLHCVKRKDTDGKHNVKVAPGVGSQCTNTTYPVYRQLGRKQISSTSSWVPYQLPCQYYRYLALSCCTYTQWINTGTLLPVTSRPEHLVTFNF